MARSRDYRCGYDAGYAAATHYRWPENIPSPPDELVAEALGSLTELLACVDHFFATTDEADREIDLCGLESARVRGIMVFERIEREMQREIIDSHCGSGPPARSIVKLMRKLEEGDG